MANDTLQLQADFKDIEAKLRALPKNLENKGASKATREVSKDVAQDAKALAPIDSGDLERSIKVRARKRSRRNKGTVGHSVVTGQRFFTGEQFYGAFQELGTQHIEADPFLRPALWSNQSKKMAKYRQILTVWLNREAIKKPVREWVQTENIFEASE